MTSVLLASGFAGSLVPHRRWAGGVLAALGLIAGGLAALDASDGAFGAVRAVATVAFMLLGPGWAVAGFLRTGSPSLLWAVAAAVGCALGALGAEAMLVLGLWHPGAGLGALVIVSVPVLLRHAVRPR